MLKQVEATIRRALEHKTLELYREAWSREKTKRKLYKICPKPIKKTLKLHKSFYKAASGWIVQMRMEKISFKKFLYSKKVSGFDSPDGLCR